MTRKRTSLDSILDPSLIRGREEATLKSPAIHLSKATQAAGNRPEVKQQTAYLPLEIHEQLRRLAFEERSKMHDYLLEGLDLVFRKRGLPSIDELREKAR